MAKRKRTPSYRPVSLSLTHWRSDGAPKMAYRTRTDALVAADERAKEAGVELNVYQCDFCGAWHMGRTQGREADVD